VIQHFCKVCSPQTIENVFKGVLLNRYPPNIEYGTKTEYLKYFTQSEYVHDPGTNFQCPLDKQLIQRALRENPDKENLYPVQMNSIKEVLLRMKSLKDADKEVLDQIEREVKLAEAFDEKFKKLYLERSLTCVKN
jgi:hypothetical protein